MVTQTSHTLLKGPGKPSQDTSFVAAPSCVRSSTTTPREGHSFRTLGLALGFP